ncbi:MAG: dTMP kinase [Tissierellia bacterium]|nr:dTMP kinase [Tissierellia bacterium]
MKGYFLTLEGPDGSGKSTIAKMLQTEIEKMGLNCTLTREPGGTEIGENIRNILLSRENMEMSDRTEALLYAASRAQHVDEKIKPLVESGLVVISDRYVFSSLAYQGYSRGLGIEKVMDINKFAMGGMTPDRILFFDIEPKVALERKFVDRIGDRLEIEGTDFHEKVYLGYKEAIKMYPNNVITIDADNDIDEVFKQCLDIVKEDINETYYSNSPR